MPGRKRRPMSTGGAQYDQVPTRLPAGNGSQSPSLADIWGISDPIQDPPAKVLFFIRTRPRFKLLRPQAPSARFLSCVNKAPQVTKSHLAASAGITLDASRKTRQIFSESTTKNRIVDLPFSGWCGLRSLILGLSLARGILLILHRFQK